jgi:hypothetical protein
MTQENIGKAVMLRSPLPEGEGWVRAKHTQMPFVILKRLRKHALILAFSLREKGTSCSTAFPYLRATL